MSICVAARSISRPVWEQLQVGLSSARVLAVFERVCDLVTSDGDVIALVIPQVDDGPLNIVLDGEGEGFATVEPGMLAQLEGELLQIGGLEVALDSAVVWEPRPDWQSLRACCGALVDRLPLLHNLSQQYAPGRSLLALTSNWAGDSTYPLAAGSLDSISDSLFATALEAAEALLAGWGGDAARLQAGAARLAGLGGGLTPAGDDFLTGAMLWGWLAHPAPGFLCRLLVEAATSRTTILSAAFLRAAARGECSAAWHTLLAALSHGSNVGVARGVQDVLAHGATSGADALAGFLWTGMQTSS